MPETREHRFGELPPLYSFALNPYPDQRVSRCPTCERKTGQRKLPLFIHINPKYPIVINYTCRYCKQCDLLIAHKHEIEHLLTTIFQRVTPGAIGNDYLIVGTVEKNAWREGLDHPKSTIEIMSQTHDFALVLRDLRMTDPGWHGPNQEPQNLEPPKPNEWIKR